VDELIEGLPKEGGLSWPVGQPNDAYARYFTGNSHLAPIAPANLPEGAATVASYANVTFEPGCRNNWHIHHGAHQILICVSGRGWYQEWGKPAIALTPGMIIDIPDEVKHWHGAQHDSWFQHLTTHVATGGEQSNEWLEAVTDDVYDKLK
jgi:4-carboxymuconolactone decarboxylase